MSISLEIQTMDINEKLFILSTLLETFGLYHNADIVVDRMTRLASNVVNPQSLSPEEWDKFVKTHTHALDDYLDVPMRAKKHDGVLRSIEPQKANLTDKIEIYNPLDDHSDKPVGLMQWDEYDSKTPFVEWTELQDKYKNKGIGSAMYDRLIQTLGRSNFNQFMSGDDVSDMARKMYQHLRNTGHDVKPITQQKHWDKAKQTPGMDLDIAQAKGGPNDFSVFQVGINPHAISKP